MRWRKGRRSQNIEDRRGQSPRAGRGMKLGGGIGIVVLLAALFLGGDPGSILGMLGGGGGGLLGQPESNAPAPTAAQNDENKQFLSAVLADTEDTWSTIFKTAGQTYRPPKLVLYSEGTTTACGYGSGASGPFYCPGDQKVYIDLSFYHEMQRLGAKGDFARAYVLGHEVAHHVQNLVGTMSKVDRLRRQSNQTDANALSVMLELQADCYAGVWTHHAHRQRNILEEGDIQEGMGAAAAVGDDRLQRMSGRGVHPESFTHGTSEQRMTWFLTGLKSGELRACNTFNQG